MCLILMSFYLAHAQNVDPTLNQAAPPTLPVTMPAAADPENVAPTLVDAPKDLSTLTLRGLSKYTINPHLSILSTWLPIKFGVGLGYIVSPDWTVEAEITRRSISAKVVDVDFGQVVDQRYGLQARWYPGSSNSFNLIMGIFKSEFSAELGNSYLNHIPGSPGSTKWKFESIGPQLGLSNRAQWSNGITFGVDWFVIYIPAFNKKVDNSVFDAMTNQSDRDDLDKVTSAIQKIPQFDLLKLTLGYTF